jgi:hypothetical protein
VKLMHKVCFVLAALRWLLIGRWIVGVPSLNRQCGAIAGLRGTGDWGADERPKSFRETILWRRPNGSAPLYALTAKMKSQAVSDPEFNWWEEELNAIRVQINYTTGYATSDETLTIDSGDAQDLVAGDVLLVEAALTTGYTHEVLVVSSVTSSTVFVVKRAQAGTTRAAIADNTFLTRIGTVFAEGTRSPDATTRNPTKLYNYCQIFKKAYDITATAEQTEARTGDPLQNDKKRRMFDYSVDVEFAFLFGKRYETTGSNGKPMRFMGGILYMLSQYARVDRRVHYHADREHAARCSIPDLGLRHRRRLGADHVLRERVPELDQQAREERHEHADQLRRLRQRLWHAAAALDLSSRGDLPADAPAVQHARPLHQRCFHLRPERDDLPLPAESRYEVAGSHRGKRRGRAQGSMAGGDLARTPPRQDLRVAQQLRRAVRR